MSTFWTNSWIYYLTIEASSIRQGIDQVSSNNYY